MARTFGKGYGRNNVVATGSDSGDQVSVNAWNDDKDAGGMLGFTSSTKTIASGKITPVDTVTIVAAEAGTADNLDLITYSDTMENDIFYLFADTGDTITVRHNQTPASGEAAIITTSAASVVLSETIPLVLQRRGTTLYQIIENSISSVTAGSTTTFTDKSIDLTDNTLTGTSAELKTAISDETGSGALVFATSPTLITPVLGTPASGALTNCSFPTLNQSTTGNADTATTSTNVTVADESTDTSCNVLFTTAATGDLPPKSGTNLTFNSNTGILTATGFAGPLTGNVTGNASGSSGSTTGNAATVTTNANLTGGVTSVGNAATVVTNANLTGDVTSTGNATTLGTVAVAKGGTNTTSYATGDILYASASTTLAKLAVGSNTHVLTLAGGVPTWAAPSGGGAHTQQQWTVYTTHTPTAAVADTSAYMFTRKIDTNNDGLYITLWKNGASQEVKSRLHRWND